MTRYFMTIPEAVQLVIRAGDIGAGKGEVFVLDMGEPVKIVDLAHNMIRLAGYEPEADIAIEFTQPRPGREAARGAVRPRRERCSRRRRGGSTGRCARTPLDPEWVESDAELARAPGDGRRRGQSGRAGGRDDHRSGRRRGGSRLRRVASRRHLLEVIKEIGAFAGLAAFLGLAVLALLSFTQGRDIRRLREWAGSAPERDAERKESTSAVAAAAGRGAAQAGGGARPPSARRPSCARRAAERREAGLPELTRGERLARRALRLGDRLAEPRYLVALFVVVVADRRRRRLRGHAAGSAATTARAAAGGKQSTAAASRRNRSRGPQRDRGRRPRRRPTATRSSARASSSAPSPTAEPASPKASSCSSRATRREAHRVAKALEISKVRPMTAEIARSRRGAPVAVVVGEDNASSAGLRASRRPRRLRAARPRHPRRLRLVAAAEARPAGPRQGPLRRRPGPAPEAPRPHSFTPNGDCRYDRIRIRFRDDPVRRRRPSRSSSPAASWSSPSPATGSSSATTSSPSTGTAAAATTASRRPAATSCGSSCWARTASWSRRA